MQDHRATEAISFMRNPRPVADSMDAPGLSERARRRRVVSRFTRISVGATILVATSAALLALGQVEAALPAHGEMAAAPTVQRSPLNLPQPPDGKQVYATTCAACHQLDGTGLTDVYPPLAES